MQIDHAVLAKITDEFDSNTWHYDHILEALTTTEGITQFVTHKLTTNPTSHFIPIAINTKFRYRDTKFFITFTKNKKYMSQHQIEYEKLFTKALEK